MAFVLKFDTDNEAFGEEDGGSEVASILRGIADKVERGIFGVSVIDSNGNSIGEWELDRFEAAYGTN